MVTEFEPKKAGLHEWERLEELRLLTEVDHLQGAINQHGYVPKEVKSDVIMNLRTAVYEIAMPSAVSKTLHKVSHHEHEGRQERVIWWLGKTAVETAQSGYDFHFSEAAHKRVDIEVAEAEHAQRTLRSGVAQIFISPKMTEFDAPSEIAKDEHLHDDDSLRVSYAVADYTGKIIARELQSLLVSDISLDAWVAMFRDSSNIFGRSFDIKNDHSALSVMELFRNLELPEDKLPEGPVTLVEAVLPYVEDEQAKASVAAQLQRFRHDQQKYHEQSEKTATEWYEFDKSIAESLQAGTANYDVRRFIATMQHEWAESDAEIIRNHYLENGEYIMTRQLAAIVEKGKREVLNRVAAVATDNEKALTGLSENELSSLRQAHQQLEALRVQGAPPREMMAQRAELERMAAAAQIKVGGGCAGNTSSAFEKGDNGKGGENSLQKLLSGDIEGDKKAWKWKQGTCRVEACPTRPGQTKVGPCEICVRCQAKFDAGLDPTRTSTPATESQPTNEKYDVLENFKKIWNRSNLVTKSREDFGLAA